MIANLVSYLKSASGCFYNCSAR